MSLTNIIILNTYSIILLVVVLTHAGRLAEERDLQDKLYFLMLKVCIVQLFLDIISRLDSKAVIIYPFLNWIGNFMIFATNMFLPSLWLLYVHLRVYRSETKTRKLFNILLGVNIANLLLVIISQFNGWLYHIDSNNIYHRGPLFLFIAIIIILYIVAAYIIVILNRKRMEKRTFYPLLFFAVPPIICIILQIKYYGLSSVLNGVVLSLLILLLNLQNQNIHTDYLTGVNNRKKLDAYLAKKIALSTKNRSFSAILIDLDNFKAINDTYGHEIGDEALRATVKLLKSCIRSNDFIARYGGDEFFIVLDISNINDLKLMVQRINNRVEDFNNSKEHVYKLGLSMGYAVYDVRSRMNATEFLESIDMMMYKNKQNIKQGNI